MFSEVSRTVLKIEGNVAVYKDINLDLVAKKKVLSRERSVKMQAV